MDLQTLWFAAVAVLWIGFLLLEGFDFGVQMNTVALGTGRRGGAAPASGGGGDAGSAPVCPVRLGRARRTVAASAPVTGVPDPVTAAGSSAA